MKILVLGLGELGMFLVRHLAESGLEICGWDINQSKRSQLEAFGANWDRFPEVDVVILALFPEQITPQLVQGLSSEALLVNVSSVQEIGLSALRMAGVGEKRLFSFHPLFGPVGVRKSGWVGKQIIVTQKPKNSNQRVTDLLDTFIRRGVIVNTMSAQEHDDKMLPHALAFLVGELVIAVLAGAVDPNCLTGSGRQLLGLLDFTNNGSPELRRLILSNQVLRGNFPKLSQALNELAIEFGWG